MTTEPFASFELGVINNVDDVLLIWYREVVMCGKQASVLRYTLFCGINPLTPTVATWVQL